MKSTRTSKEEFILLRARGLSFEKISKTLHKSKQTLVNWSRELEEEISNLKSMELEALNEEYYLAKENKIRLFGDLLKKIKTELEGRDLSDISTDKLMDLFLKYYAVLEAEKADPVFRSSEEMYEAKSDKRALQRLTASAGSPGADIDLVLEVG